MNAMRRRWAVGLAAIGLVAGACSQPVTPYPFEYMLLGYLKVIANLADAGGAPTGLVALADVNVDSVKVRLLGDGDSTRTTDGQYLFRALPGSYRAASEVAGQPTDSTRVITITNVDLLTTDTLKVARRGDLTTAPNPFQTSTSLHFTLAADDDVTIQVVTLAGTVVRTLSGSFPAGQSTLVWNGTNDAGLPAVNGWYVVVFASSTDQRMDVVIKEP